jgi:hypothetical protein
LTRPANVYAVFIDMMGFASRVRLACTRGRHAAPKSTVETFIAGG